MVGGIVKYRQDEEGQVVNKKELEKKRSEVIGKVAEQIIKYI